MPRDKNFKRRVRAWMSVTGERYTQAMGRVRSVGGAAPTGVPGWHLAGSHPADYEIGLEPDSTPRGGNTAYLRCIAERPGGFGTIMQTISAEEYVGKRAQLSVLVRGDRIERWAGLWMRVDGPPGGSPLAFDNMESRSLRASFDWRRVDVVLDVATEAVDIAFGVLLGGSGSLWMSDFELEAVGEDVPVTNSKVRPLQPRNLDFSQTEESP
jgi:hypothetical protein